MSHGEKTLIRLTGIHCQERMQTRMRSRAPKRLPVLPACDRAHVYSQKQTETKSGQLSLNLCCSVSVFFFFFFPSTCFMTVRTHTPCIVCASIARKVSALLMQLIFPLKLQGGKKNKIKQTEQQDFDGCRGETLSSK